MQGDIRDKENNGIEPNNRVEEESISSPSSFENGPNRSLDKGNIMGIQSLERNEAHEELDLQTKRSPATSKGEGSGAEIELDINKDEALEAWRIGK